VIADFDFAEIDDCLLLPARLATYRRIHERCHSWIAVSKRMSDSMQRVVPQARVRIVYNGVSPPARGLFDRPRPAYLAGKILGFSACHFYNRKGVPLLVEAFARATSQRPDAILRIAGDGIEKRAVLDAIERNGVSGRVELLGVLAPTEVLQQMIWADYFALVGWDEPFATVYLEAMSVGIPIICANDGGINDLLVDGQHGLVVIPRDVVSAASAISRMIESPQHRQQMGKNARRLYHERLTPEALAAQLSTVLNEAAGSASN
jgi:glycosyltransferase involved in cell wall biosynthesis